MRVIIPAINQTLVSSTIPEPDTGEVVYNAATTYGLGARAISTSTHRIYESLQAGNVGKPLPVPPLTETAWWIEVGVTNRYASVDLARNTQSIGPESTGQTSMTVVVKPNERSNAMALMGMEANTCVITVPNNGPTTSSSTELTLASSGQVSLVIGSGLSIARDSGILLTSTAQSLAQMTGKVVSYTPATGALILQLNGKTAVGTYSSWTVTNHYYARSFDLRLRRVRDGYEYAFKPFDLQPSVVLFDLPLISSMEVKVTLTRTSGSVKLGSFLVGTYAYLGATQYNAENDALNFSTVERDIYGNATLIPRRTLPKTLQTLRVNKAFVSDLIDVRSRLNAVPAVWSGLDDKGEHEYFEALLILGIYKQFKINASYPDEAEVTLELEEI